MSNPCKFYLEFPVTKSYYIAEYDEDKLRKGDYVIADVEGLGKEFLKVAGKAGACGGDYDKVQIEKLADEADIKARDEALSKKDEYYTKVKKALESEKFELSLVDVHLGAITNTLTIFYTANDIVDFRNFVKNAYQKIGLRVNMRQLRRPRDPGKFFDSCGVCGRKTCCSSSACRPERCNVSIKVLKEQNLMPNSAKNVGLCGLLCCCMSYEAEYYRNAKSIFPKLGDEVAIEHKKYKVMDINYISSKIKLENKDELSVIVVSLDDLNRDDNGNWYSLQRR